MQGLTLKRLFQMPKTTPYLGILMETGSLPMRDRIAYRKMMLYHNIVNLDGKRIMKKIVLHQEQHPRPGTWVQCLQELASKYGIELKEAKQMRKEKWKKKVKQAVRNGAEIEMRKEMASMTKLRTIKDEDYTMQDYIKLLNEQEASTIMKIRLHMVQASENFRRKSGEEEKCPLCLRENDTTEHIFECKSAQTLRKIWDTEFNHVKSNEISKLKNTIKYIEAYQKMRK